MLRNRNVWTRARPVALASRTSRPPFVVSVAAPVAFGLACGGKSEPGDTNGNPESSSVSSGGSAPFLPDKPEPCYGCNPPAYFRDCPEITPAAGTSCAEYERDLRCLYGGCGPEAASRRCSPDNARWEAGPVAACNPPALEPCPTTLPPAGSDCALEGQECRYPICEGYTPTSATCRFGQWAEVNESYAGCNPPAVVPVCPQRARNAGDGCVYEGQECSYEACMGASHEGLVCRAGQWQAVVLACAWADAGPDSGP